MSSNPWRSDPWSVLPTFTVIPCRTNSCCSLCIISHATYHSVTSVITALPTLTSTLALLLVRVATGRICRPVLASMSTTSSSTMCSAASCVIATSCLITILQHHSTVTACSRLRNLLRHTLIFHIISFYSKFTLSTVWVSAAADTSCLLVSLVPSTVGTGCCSWDWSATFSVLQHFPDSV